MRHSTPQPRIPIGLIAILLAPLLLIVLGALAWLAWQFQQLNPAVAAIVRAALFLLPIGLAVETGVIVWRRWATHRYIEAHHVTQAIRARNQPAPQATSFTYHNAPRIDGVSREETQPTLALPEPEPPSVPTFGQLLDTGKIGPGRPLLLGYNAATGEAIEGSWKDLYSCGIGGMTGSGKSWLAAFLIAQSAAAGARLIVIDPHAGDDESLSSRIDGLSSAYMCDVASSTDQIKDALKLASDKLQARKQGRGGRWPILLICDEWTSLLRGALADELTAAALDIAEQGRKYDVYGMFAAQAWQVDAAGAVRDRLASHYVLRQRPDQARYQLGLRAGQLPFDTRFLKDAEAYMLTVKGNLTKIVIPHMTPADLARVGTLIAAPAAATGQPFGFNPAPKAITATAQNGAEMEPKWSRNGAGSTAVESRGAVSPEAARAASLFIAGSSPAQIVMELRGVSSKQSGSKYQAALNEVLDLIRAGMMKGGD